MLNFPLPDSQREKLSDIDPYSSKYGVDFTLHVNEESLYRDTGVVFDRRSCCETLKQIN